MITKEKFKAYLKVQKGGKTNMWDVNRVCILSNDILEKADVIDIIKNYGEYKDKFKLTMDDVKV